MPNTVVDLSDKSLYTNVYWKIQDCKKRFVVSYGGAGCFDGEQKVITKDGNKPIKDIKKNDLVLTHNHVDNINEWQKVVDHIKQPKSKKIINIKLKNGTLIRVTENHEFFYGGEYIKIIDLLVSLAHDKMEKNSQF